MSTTSASQTSNASGSSQTGATKSASGNAQRADKSAQTPTDLFASLLGLLGATFEGPLNADGTENPAPGSTAGDELEGSGDADDSGLNPLASLLSWPGAPVLQSELPTPGKDTASADLRGASTGKEPRESLGSATPAPGAADATTSDSSDLQGMTLLDQPVEADAELRASLEAATQGSGKPRSNTSNAIRPDASALASRATNWRSTTALAHNAASAAASGTPTSTSQIQLGHMTQVRMSADTGLPTARSTLTFDDRFNATSLGEGTSPALGGLSASGHASPQGGADQQPSGSGAFAESLSAERAERGAGESEFELMPDNLAEELAPEEFALSPHQLRHASLRVGEGSEDAIDIQLALRGEQLNVDFRTDNADARASLQNHASGALSDLLQRGGIQLGQVSVGAQSQNPGQDRQGQPETRSSSSTPAGRIGASGLSSNEDARLPQAPLRRSDGSRPLDLFV